jgi:hypothetical protein
VEVKILRRPTITGRPYPDTKKDTPMPANVAIGQKWSVWAPGRRQWLLATVMGRKNGQATLKYDLRYEMDAGQDEQVADEAAMLTETNLFRYVES